VFDSAVQVGTVDSESFSYTSLFPSPLYSLRSIFKLEGAWQSRDFPCLMPEGFFPLLPSSFVGVGAGELGGIGVFASFFFRLNRRGAPPPLSSSLFSCSFSIAGIREKLAVYLGSGQRMLFFFFSPRAFTTIAAAFSPFPSFSFFFF